MLCTLSYLFQLSVKAFQNKNLAVLGRGNIRLKLVPLIHAGVTSNGAHVDHAVPEFHKGTTLLGKLDIGNVLETEVCQGLVFLLAQPLDKAVGG